MKNLSLIAFFALLVAFVGCSKDNSITPLPSSDTQAIQSMVTSVDSVSQFTQSDESVIGDQDETTWAKAGADAVMTPINIFKWGRRVTTIDRSVTVTYIGDTTAVAWLSRTVSGNIVIAASYSDTAQYPDTLIRKPFREQLDRKIIFSRIAHNDDHLKNWIPVALSLDAAETIPDSLNAFSIEKLEVTTTTDTLTITDPLNTWLKLGNHHGCIPVVMKDDSVLVRLTLTSTDDSSESVALRWTGDVRTNRLRMKLVSSTAVSGGYERVYQLKIRAFLPLGRALGRYNVVADVNSWGTLNDDNLRVSNKMWGFPYNTRRR